MLTELFVEYTKIWAAANILPGPLGASFDQQRLLLTGEDQVNLPTDEQKSIGNQPAGTEFVAAKPECGWTAIVEINGVINS